MDFQSTAAFVFILLLTLFLIIKRKEITTQKILFPLLYFSMYRTRWGIKSMDFLSKRFSRPLLYLALAGIVIGFAGMVLIAVTLFHNMISQLMTPDAAPGVALVLPFKVKGSFFVPFFYWIIAIFVIAVVHEFAHGVVARLHKVRIKSSGFAFLGVILPIIPAAFVEPEEKQVRRLSRLKQLSIYSAGPFSNILTALLVLVIFIFAVSPAANALFDYNGVSIKGFTNETGKVFPAQEAGMSAGERIIKVDAHEIYSVDNFTRTLREKKPGDVVTITTNVSSYYITLAENPEDRNMSYMGIYVAQSSKVKESVTARYGRIIPAMIIWFIGLLYWLYVLNLGIGLFNLVPLGPLDGGRMLLVTLQKFMKPERAEKTWKGVSALFLFLIIANLSFAFFG